MSSNSADHIPIYEPYLRGREREYVLDCVDSSWISSSGDYIKKFEDAVSERTGIKHGIAVFNGTVALHLALHCAGVGPGDEVLVPTFTYIASVNAIITTGATPVFVDSDPVNWQIDVQDAETKITPRTKAIMPVHLYGFCANPLAIEALANQYGITVIDDGAESLGVYCGGEHVGARSRAITFSFFGNKTVTTGEGGMVMTNDDALAESLRLTKHHGMSPTRRYWHDRVGFNYRMTNIQAAIGLAQMEQFDEIVRRKQAIYNYYRDGLRDQPLEWQSSTENQSFDSSYWLVSLLASDASTRDRILAHLEESGIGARPVFHCAHTMPPYMAYRPEGKSYPVAENLSQRGLSIPSYPSLSPEQQDRVIAAVKAALD